MIQTYNIKVRFNGSSNDYPYKSFEKRSVGDLVVVELDDVIGIAKVSETDCNDSFTARYVIGGIDIEEFHRLVKAHEAQKVLEDRLEQLCMETSKMDMYRKLVETNEEARGLVEQLEKIN